MSIRCLVIDDKPLGIDILVDYINKTPFLQLAATTTNPIEGLTIIRSQPIDLIFLDIQMPELTGLQFMAVAGRQCKVILVTAYAEFALDGFENDVIDYLLKPVSFDRFYRAAEKAAYVINKPIAPLTTRPTHEFIFFKTENKILRVDLKDIRYIEGLQNYIAIYTLTEKILTLQTLKSIEAQLQVKDFIRVHKSYIISLRHISSIERSRIFISNTIIPIGDNYRDEFFKAIGTSS